MAIQEANTLNASLLRWTPLTGRWSVENGKVQFLNPSMNVSQPHGIILSDASFRDGIIRVKTKFSSLESGDAARILLNFDAKTKEYISVGLGGYGQAFVVSRFLRSFGWTAIAAEGDGNNLNNDQEYDLEVSVKGQTIALQVDGVKMIDLRLDEPLPGSQVGLFVWGHKPVEFNNFALEQSPPHGFVVMDFSGQFDALYQEVLLPTAERAGLELRRADDIKGPGIILQDVVEDIAQATVIVAEITQPNPNVFYELGYAHALKKPTILLVRRGEARPFDVAGYRCIIYDDSIAGKSSVEKEFRQHLKAILGE